MRYNLSYPLEKSPKKGFVIADLSKDAAELNVAVSTLARGRNKKSPLSVLSNPQSSRNSIPPFTLATLSCSQSFIIMKTSLTNDHKMQ